MNRFSQICEDKALLEDLETYFLEVVTKSMVDKMYARKDVSNAPDIKEAIQECFASLVKDFGRKETKKNKNRM